MIKIDFDRDFLRESTGFLSGVDEVGRGCLAGPVVSSCVCLEYEKYKEAESCLVSLAALGVTDSKKLSPKKRQQIIKHFHLTRSELKLDQKFLLWEFNNCSLTAAISSISNTWIDKMNILNASLLSMKNAFEQVYTKNRDGILLVDGNRIPALHHLPIIVKPVVKGDQKSLLIALSSILAKEYRDFLMFQMDAIYPAYNFKNNVGYGTAEHLNQLKQKGRCRIHRQTFKGVIPTDE
ncbi:MAG: hypothetical protein A2381_03025 [Bdellovibrionales bacterium RIFOXYB1_FULL_37_110]|nr:MAG: hypothetical protein A2181_03405 [Bdellovibrionales bacterium RIFOXYA1_FULL_38_20]OFZ51479.1 MAG: hypothetical protein A2417_09480 [Bdellovibrionales bacterium RIFOXYC1_FULL_37_79]OFZ57907.1 MAG: hypothetical protein A2381_03025 [Bdellovibrionales bacterium RIFOXYB1_FULL_37_110]OFZ63633.1 MAG: hypothetical protein A2577_05325 [Bdellovibrionales bacterium RIFOXYD1_FULL_36_51]